MLDFETGVQIGQAIGEIKAHGRRLDHREGEVADLKQLVMRAMLLAALWVVGVGGNLTAEQIGQAGAALLQAWLK